MMKSLPKLVEKTFGGFSLFMVCTYIYNCVGMYVQVFDIEHFCVKSNRLYIRIYVVSDCVVIIYMYGMIIVAI